MVLTTLLLVLVLGSAPDTDPAKLVSQLGAARYADREAAARALAKMGAKALPALRQAAESKDPEVRTRASALLEQIDTELLTQPTLVQLDFEEKPLAEVASALSDRSGMPIQLQPENHAIWKSKKVTLKTDEPVRFWQAIDLLCQEGGLSYTQAVQTGFVPRVAGVRLTPGAVPLPPHSDHGPFRTFAVSVHHHKDMGLGQSPFGGPGMVPPPPPMPGVDIVFPAPAQRRQNSNETFYVIIQVVAEPRLGLPRAEAAHLQSATDDDGQSLLPGASAPANPHVTATSTMALGGTGQGYIQTALQLKYPEHPGKQIKTLKGTVPVIVTMRKPDPLVMRLDDPDAVGKTVRAHDVSLRLEEVKKNDGQAGRNNNRDLISFTVRNLAPPAEEVPLAAVPGAIRARGALVPPRLPLFSQTQYEVLDAAGKALPAFVSSYSSSRGDVEESRVTLSLVNARQQDAPVELRYYVLTHTETSIPFEFSDIPMP